MAETHHCEDCQKLNTATRLYKFAPLLWNSDTSTQSTEPFGFSVANSERQVSGKNVVEVCRPCLDKRIADFWDSF
jgi:hypothetical protein